MQSNRSRDTKSELAVSRVLHAHGLRYGVDRRKTSAASEMCAPSGASGWMTPERSSSKNVASRT